MTYIPSSGLSGSIGNHQIAVGDALGAITGSNALQYQSNVLAMATTSGNVAAALQTGDAASYSFIDIKSDAREYNFITGGSGTSDVPGKIGILDRSASSYRMIIGTDYKIALGDVNPATMPAAGTAIQYYKGSGPCVFLMSQNDNNDIAGWGSSISSNRRMTLEQHGAGAPLQDKFALHDNTDGVYRWVVDNTNGNFGIGTTAPKERLSVKSHSAYTGSEVNIGSATATTTDATQTVIWSKTLSDNTVYYVFVDIVARRTDMAANGRFTRNFLVYREAAGGATLGAAVITPWLDETTGTGWTINVGVSANDVQVKVTGEAGANVVWGATIRYQSVSTSA